VQNPSSPYFDQADAGVLRIDKVAWLQRAFDLAMQEYARLDLDHSDPITEIDEAFDRGLEGVGEAEVRKQMTRIEGHLAQLAKATKLYAHVQNDVLKLKYYHQRYSNYLRWLTWK
jgi:MoxR-like ATPase